MSQQQQTILRVQLNNTSTGTTEYVILDLYSSIPIKINRNYADLQDISTKNSDTALNVTLPGSKNNNKFFENFFDVDMQSFRFSAIRKVSCQVLINDEAYFVGYMKLNKINIQNSKVEYDVSLFSTVSTLFADMGNFLLTDLNYDDEDYTFNHTFGLGTVTNGWYYSNFSKNQEQPQPYLYPIVHNGYLYTGSSVNISGGTIDSQSRLYTSSPIKQGAYSTAALAFADGVKPYQINSPGSGIIDNQLKPALSIWNLIKLIFKTYGYSIKSDFMNTPWMKTLYMYGYFSSNLTKFSYQIGAIPILSPNNVDIIINPSTGLTEFDMIVVQSGTGVPVYCSDPINVTVNIVRRWQDDLHISYNTYYDETYTIDPNTSGYTKTLNQNIPSNTTYRHYNGQRSATSGFINVGFAPLNSIKYFPVEPNGYVNFKDGDFVNFSQVIDPQFKQIDFLSSIAKKFNLVFVPDPYVPNRIIIEPYSYYIGTGDIWDWTDKLSYDQGFTVEPATNYVDNYLTFYDVEDGDYGNKQFKDINNRIYGQKFVPNTVTNFKSVTGETKTTFSTEVFRQWDTADQSPNGGITLPLGINYAGTSNIQQVSGQEQTFYQYTGVKTKPKFMWFLQGANILNQYSSTGTTENLTYSASTYNVWIGPSNAPTGTTSSVYSKQENVPIMSNAMPIGMQDKYKINNDNLSILFNAEAMTYIDVYTYNTYTNVDSYNNFYSNRINNLFNPNTRFLTGKFYLKLSDYKNLKAQDLIKIKDQYFYWNKINGYNLTDTELTEVELVQSNLNPASYPIRYFKYQYCDVEDYVFKIATDFTNPNLLHTNFGWSIFYDHSSAIIYGDNPPSGITSTLTYVATGTTTPNYYVPFTMEEIDKDHYDNYGYYDYTDDTLMMYIYGIEDGPFGKNMPTYYVNSGSTLQGLNLFNSCSSFDTIASPTNVGIRVGSSTYFGPPNYHILNTELSENIRTELNNNIQTQQ